MASKRTYPATPLVKLVLLHVATLGLYRFYWFYKQWQFVPGTSALGRAVFFPFYAQVLFDRVRIGAIETGRAPRWNASGLGVLVLVLVVLEQVVAWSAAAGDHWPGTASLYVAPGTLAFFVATGLALMSAVPLYLVQGTSNALSGEPKVRLRFSLGELIALALGSIVWFGIFAKLIAPEWYGSAFPQPDQSIP